MSEVQMLRRGYIVLAPAIQAQALQDALDALPECVAASITFQIVEGLGPEAAPDAGVSATVTHRLDAPVHDEVIFSAVRAEVLASWPAAYVHDTTWWVLDNGVVRTVMPDHPDPRDVLMLHQYDETWGT